VPAVAVKRRERVLLDTGCKKRLDGGMCLWFKEFYGNPKSLVYNTITLELQGKQQYFKCKSENFKYLKD